MNLIGIIVIILPCIYLLRWGVSYTKFTLKEINNCGEKVPFLQTIRGFYVFYLRETTRN